MREKQPINLQVFVSSNFCLGTEMALYDRSTSLVYCVQYFITS